jgi:[ribosomal protein S5]-alanine N-acetyltransferase
MSIMTSQLQNETVLLIPLDSKIAEEYRSLYTNEKVIEHYEEDAIKSTESSLQFTLRIIKSYNHIWSIRSLVAPHKIIGDIALHDYDPLEKPIKFGGTLLPSYWGNGIMQSAFSLIIPFVKKNYAVERILAKTTESNKRAISFANKLGFVNSIDNILLLKL